jgi:peptidoglycan/xylan/chitin deacetylase (PgdA/CDA1 family)
MNKAFVPLLFCLAAPAADNTPVGVLKGDPMERMGVKANEFRDNIRFVRKSVYLNNTRAVVTHTIDDSTKYVPACLDAMDKYGIKATIFISTEREPILELWPRLRNAIDNGHEIGSHSRRHQCKWPDTADFCEHAYSEYEIRGSRDDILKNTQQPYVWSWCFPCGNCASLEFVQQRLKAAGYLVARNYPKEAEDGHLVPDLQTYDQNPYNATYTQVAQRKGGIAKSGLTDVEVLNAKFDEVYQRGGIYNLLSHPQWLDYGEGEFYERHLAHVGGKGDVWYVPMGPLYAYRTAWQRTQIQALRPGKTQARFAIFNDLDSKIYDGSITLEFIVPPGLAIFSSGKLMTERKAGLTDRWNVEYFRRVGKTVYVTVHSNTVLEFR